MLNNIIKILFVNKVLRIAITIIMLFEGFLSPILSVQNLYAFDWSDSLIIKVTPKDNRAPMIITDLTAYTGDGEGQVKLEWTAPFEDNPPYLNSESVETFEVRFATFNVDSLSGNTTEWWNNAKGVEIFPSVRKPGRKEIHTLSLEPRITYYFSMKGIDDSGNVSEIDLKSTIATIQAKAVAQNCAPAPIINITALPGNREGRINLIWKTTGDDGTTGNVIDGMWQVKYTTNSFSSKEDAEYNLTWTTNTIQGEINKVVINDLEPDVTYYFWINLQDDVDNWSENGIRAETYAQHYIYYPISITDLAGKTDDTVDGKLSLNWTSIGGKGYIFKYDVKNPGIYVNEEVWWENATQGIIGFTPGIEGEKESIDTMILTAGVTYYIAMKADFGRGHSSDISNIIYVRTGDKIPVAPQNLQAHNLGNRIKILWERNVEPDIKEYIIYKKQWNIFSEIGRIKHPEKEYLDYSVANNNKYTYKIKAVDNTGHVSDFSNETEVILGEVLVYSDIDIINITEIKSNSLIMEWPKVVAQDNQIKGYAIEKTEDILGKWEEIGFVYSTDTLRFVVPIQDKEYYYRIVTVSWYDLRSTGLLSIKATDDPQHIYLSEDKNAWAEISNSFINEMYVENNNGKPIKIEFVKENIDGFLSVYNIKAVNGKEITDFVFKNSRKGAKIVISYNQLQNTSISKAPAINQQLVLFWFNGVEWIKLGGINDVINSRMYTNARKLGKYGIKLANKSNEFTLNAIIPKIFTPEEANSLINNIRFYFENPNFVEVTIRIFDINGAIVMKNLRREGENVMVWDGRDMSGNIVKGGIYIYQVEAENKIINGTIVVAK